MQPPSNPTPELKLDLSGAPRVLFFYGLAGSGKSFVGNLVGRLTGWYVYHADEDVTEEMRIAIKQRKSFTDEMRDRYFSLVADRILELRNDHERIVVTQAVYKEKHREFLRSKIPEIELVLVTASDDLILSRLLERGDDVTPEYAAVTRKTFETPSKDKPRIINEGDEGAIVAQLNHLYGKASR